MRLLFTYKSDADEQRMLLQFSEEEILFLHLISVYFELFFQKHLEFRRHVFIYNKSK